jgi:hypothetical protein
MYTGMKVHARSQEIDARTRVLMDSFRPVFGCGEKPPGREKHLLPLAVYICGIPSSSSHFWYSIRGRSAGLT